MKAFILNSPRAGGGTGGCPYLFSFPAVHRKKIRTTNNLERFNEEIRRRRRVIRIFPDEEVCLRLICALCIEQNEEWRAKRR